MNKTYETILALCEQKGISYNFMCKQLGFYPSVVGNLKSRPERTLNAKYASEIAKYLGVSIDYILYGEKEKTATDGDDLDALSEKDKRFIEWFRSLSEEKQKAILIAQDAPADLF